MATPTGRAGKAFGALPFALLGVVGMLFTGCPSRPAAEGEAGAADLPGLVARYEQAHRAKDIDSLRAIYIQLEHPVRGRQMIGEAERHIPVLFEVDLVGVQVVEVAGGPGETTLDYLVEREPSRANGFDPVRLDSASYPRPYKLVLLGRRPADPAGPVLEIDPCLGVTAAGGRLYLYASESVLSATADWVQTGRLPGVYRPPGHTFRPGPGGWPKRIPDDWVRIVRPRP